MLDGPYETYERPGVMASYRFAGALIYRGAMLGLLPTGYVAPIGIEPGMRFVGIAAENSIPSRSSEPAASSGRMAVCKSGSFVFACAEGWEPNGPDMGSLVYPWSDWEVSTTPREEGEEPVGRIVGFETTANGKKGARIRIDLHVY